MAPYIFMEKGGIHIIDLHKTVEKIDEAAAAIKQIAKSGRRILFVATKKQAKDIVAEKVQAVGTVGDIYEGKECCSRPRSCSATPRTAPQFDFATLRSG